MPVESRLPTTLPGGRGVKEDLNVNNESYDNRARSVIVDEELFLSTTFPNAVPGSVTISSTTANFDPLPLLATPFQAVEVKASVAVAEASKKLHVALYYYNRNLGRIHKVSGSAASYSIASTGDKSAVVKCVLLPGVQYFLGYISDSWSTGKVRGGSLATGCPLSFRGVPWTTTTERKPLPANVFLRSVSSTNSSDVYPNVVYLSTLGKGLLD